MDACNHRVCSGSWHPGLFLPIQPLRDQRALFDQQINTIRAQQSDFAQQQEELVLQIESDPAMMMQRQIEGLQKSISTNEVKLKEIYHLTGVTN